MNDQKTRVPRPDSLALNVSVKSKISIEKSYWSKWCSVGQTLQVKSERIFKSFEALSLEENQAKNQHVPAPSISGLKLLPDHQIAGSGDAAAVTDEFQDLDQRYTAPYATSYSYRHWGINE